jgi:hypothetical protein
MRTEVLILMLAYRFKFRTYGLLTAFFFEQPLGYVWLISVRQKGLLVKIDTRNIFWSIRTKANRDTKKNREYEERARKNEGKREREKK